MDLVVFFLIIFLIGRLGAGLRRASSPPEKKPDTPIAVIDIKGVPPEAIRVTRQDGRVMIEIEATGPPDG